MDRGVLATANELFESRHYPGVVALVDDALEGEPDHVPLLLLRARAHFALRRDLEAQAGLRDIIRLDPQCGSAYRLLGELAARRDEYESAAIFFREALRLHPDDADASDWLAIVEFASRPAAAASKLPALAAAAGRLPTRVAKGTRSPDDGPDHGTERVTEPYGGPKQPFDARSRPITIPCSDDWARPETHSPHAIPLAVGTRPEANPFEGRPPKLTIPGAQPAPRPMTRPIPEMPGFGDYLVSSGILTRERLRAAQAYQRSMKVQLSTAIVTLGLATPQRIEWAAVAHQSQLARQR
jgi:tetratricopeptide (TPR) repeat protein